MATAVIMPRQGQSVESCIITKWHKQPGDKVALGDLLFTYETDKATFDCEAEAEGTLLGILRPEGDDVPVLENVAVIGAVGEDISAFGAGAAAPEVKEEPKAEVKQEAAAPVIIVERPQGEFKISPRARNLAEKTGVDVRMAVPTGAEGRVIERDVQALREAGVMATPAAAGQYEAQTVSGTGIGGRVSTSDLNAPAAAAAPAAPAAAAADYEDVKLPNIRKVIAKAMHASLANTAQLTLHSSFDATDIMTFRKSIKANAEKLGLPNITLNDIILYAVSRTLPQHRGLNAHMLEDSMRYFNHVNIGIAVDTERGLLVPTLFNAETKTLSAISSEAKELAVSAQKGTIAPDLLRGGSFTVTNLGTLDIEMFTPVLNAPQTGILGVNTIVNRVREDGSVYPAMGLSLTFDHRAIDGAPAARFLKDLKANLENFTALLAK